MKLYLIDVHINLATYGNMIANLQEEKVASGEASLGCVSFEVNKEEGRVGWKNKYLVVSFEWWKNEVEKNVRKILAVFLPNDSVWIEPKTTLASCMLIVSLEPSPIPILVYFFPQLLLAFISPPPRKHNHSVEEIWIVQHRHRTWTSLSLDNSLDVILNIDSTWMGILQWYWPVLHRNLWI